MAFEAFRLPDWNVHSIHTVTHTSNNTGNDQLDFLSGRGLQDGTDNHDPAADSDAALTAKAIGCQESENGTDKTANVVDGGNNTFEVGIWVIKVPAEGLKADDRSQYALIIAKQLLILVINRHQNRYGEPLTRKATPQHAAIAPLKMGPLRLPRTIVKGLVCSQEFVEEKSSSSLV